MDKTETLDVREAPLDFALEEDTATQDVPAYLRETYWWAYLHPRAVKIFEHQWIVNLIRNAQLDAKIDSQAKHVIMASKQPSVHQQVFDQTQNLLLRTYFLSSHLDRLKQS